MQPGIVAELAAGRQVLLDPALQWRLLHADRRDDLGVGLLGRLDGVAAVDDQRGLVGQHDGVAGRAGEAGQPGQAGHMRRDILALVLVGARDDEAVETLSGQCLAQGGDAAGDQLRIARLGERLETAGRQGRIGHGEVRLKSWHRRLASLKVPVQKRRRGAAHSVGRCCLQAPHCADWLCNLRKH